MLPDDRRELWLLGLGLGLCADAGLLLAAVAARWSLTILTLGRWAAVGVSVTTLGLFGLPLFVYGLRGLWVAACLVAAAWETKSAPPAPPAGPVAPLVAAPDDEPDSYTVEIDRLTRQREFQIAHWQVYYRRLVAAGCAYGWDTRTLTDKKRETRVTSQPGWNLATDMLVRAGLMAKDQAGTRLLISEADWVAGRWWEKVPAPEGEPPEILPPPYSRQQTAANTAPNTIEGVRADG